MSTKFKIILIVFVVLIMLLGVQYLVQQLNASPKQRRTEHFQTSLDDTPNEAKETTKDSAEKPLEKESSKDAKLRILDQVQTVFDKYSPSADQKAKIFDVLMNKEHFEELKTLKPVDLEKYITDFVSDKLTPKKKETFEHETDESEDKDVDKDVDEELAQLQHLAKQATKSIDTFISPKKEEFVDSGKIVSELDEIIKKIEAIQKHVKDTEHVSSLVPPAPKPSVTAPAKKEKESKTLIEGFENRMQFAFI